jgi:hypothetical protein
LKRNPDGSLDIYIQHRAPAGRLSNWLPTPASRQFEVMLRLYGPERRPLDCSYRYADHPRTSWGAGDWLRACLPARRNLCPEDGQSVHRVPLQWWTNSSRARAAPIANSLALDTV